MNDLNENLENHIMRMSHELLDEHKQQQKLSQQLNICNKRIKKQQDIMKKRHHLVKVARRRHENIVFDLAQVLKSRDFKHWKLKIKKVQDECGTHVKNITKALPHSKS